MGIDPGRDYGLLGPNGAAAVGRGLADGDWYACPVDRRAFKSLIKRSDGPAIRDTSLWLGLLIGSGTAGVFLWGSWWAAGPFAIYGVLYGSASDSRWHECGHGTAFRTPWMNEAVYQVASFMIGREPTVWRWSHVRHHTDTIIVGRDPEINVMRPANIARIVLNLLGLRPAALGLRSVLRHAGGRLTAEEATFIPASENGRVTRVARVWLAILLAVAALCVATRSPLPAMLVGLPTIYGAWLQVIFGITQHAGLDEDILDHRLNSRTVMMNPVFRFIYWNMNYHVEHHMFPLVPFHALPRLHALIRDDCPRAYPSLAAAYREIIPAVLRQASDPTYFVRRTLPPPVAPAEARLQAAE